MENWLKQNWFKVGILVAVVVIVIGALFYFVKYLPGVETRKLFSQNVARCQGLGEKHYKGLQSGIDEYIQLFGSQFADTIRDYQYTYDPKRGACFFYLSKEDNCLPHSDCRHYFGIRNLDTNQVLSEYSWRDEEKYTNPQGDEEKLLQEYLFKLEADFRALKAEIFGE